MKIELSGIKNSSIFKDFAINESKQKEIVENIFLKKKSDMLGWVDIIDITKEKINEIQLFAKKIRSKFKNFVVLGIGGSALGVKMLKHAFFDSINNSGKIKTFVCDNIDSDYFVSLLNSLDIKKTVFNVITKSGTTCETLAQMSMVIKILQEKRLKPEKHIFVTTTQKNDLYNFAKSQKFSVFDIPKDVGGRFSVLSNVGLIPASIMGLDIESLLQGAREVRDNSKKIGKKNLSYLSACINFTCLQNKLTNLVFMPYSDRLSLASDYFAQLWAESLGKKYNLKGEEVFTGQNPIKALGVTDQHSQLQLYTEGPEDKLFIFLKLEKQDFDFKLDYEIPFMDKLNKINLSKLFNFEFNATRFSLTQLDKPNYSIYLEKIDEKNMGALIFYLQMMTAFMGEMMGINTYNQDGVEASKIYTKASLGFANLEKQKEQINNFVNNQEFINLN